MKDPKVTNQFLYKIRGATKLDIVKVFSLTSISTLVKMLAGFISIKVVAVIIGPAGVALLGQLNNFSAIIMAIATGGITTGITKYISQYKEDSHVVKDYTCAAVKISLFCTGVCGIFLVGCYSLLSKKFLLDAQYGFVFIVFGVTLIFYTANTLLLAVINGYKQFDLYVKISIVSSVVGLGLSLALVIPFGINGALLNAVTSQSLIFVIALIIARKKRLFYLNKPYIWKSGFDSDKTIKLLRFSIMALVSGFAVPVSQLIIRGYIEDKFSLQSAGWWEGINRLSAMWLMIIVSSFSVYYLPRLSELTSGHEIWREIKTAYKIIMPCLFVGLSFVYFSRFIIINVVFSPEFHGMSELFLWQVIGDFFKISAWLVAYLMHAKAMTRFFIITEIGFTALYVFMAIILAKSLGLPGIVLAYAINYAIYWIVMWWSIYKRLK